MFVNVLTKMEETSVDGGVGKFNADSVDQSFLKIDQNGAWVKVSAPS